MTGKAWPLGSIGASLPSLRSRCRYWRRHASRSARASRCAAASAAHSTASVQPQASVSRRRSGRAAIASRSPDGTGVLRAAPARPGQAPRPGDRRAPRTPPAGRRPCTPAQCARAGSGTPSRGPPTARTARRSADAARAGPAAPRRAAPAAARHLGARLARGELGHHPRVGGTDQEGGPGEPGGRPRQPVDLDAEGRQSGGQLAGEHAPALRAALRPDGHDAEASQRPPTRLRPYAVTVAPCRRPRAGGCLSGVSRGVSVAARRWTSVSLGRSR